MNRAAIMREAHWHWRYAHAEAARAAGESLALWRFRLSNGGQGRKCAHGQRAASPNKAIFRE